MCIPPSFRLAQVDSVQPGETLTASALTSARFASSIWTRQQGTVYFNHPSSDPASWIFLVGDTSFGGEAHLSSLPRTPPARRNPARDRPEEPTPRNPC